MSTLASRGVRMEAVAGGNHIRGYNNCQVPIEEVGSAAGAKSTNTFT